MARGGHVGSGKSVSLIFYFKAKDIFDAMAKCKRMPAVKHNRSNTIQSAMEITEEEYNECGLNHSAYDVYNDAEEN